MNDQEIRKLVDKGRSLKEKLDATELELDKIKGSLKSEAKARKVGYFLGSKHFCRIGPTTSTEVDPYETFSYFEGINDRESFFDCCKILVGKAKELMGESLLASVSKSESVPYNKIAFYAKAPKSILKEQ